MISNEYNDDAFLYEAEHGQIEEPINKFMIPCPWCNFKFVCFEPVRVTSFISKYGVVCRKCKCHGPLKETVEEAIEAWNNRVEPIGNSDELKQFSTTELITELCNRGHSEYTIGDRCEYCITADYGEDVAVCAYGPARIIVVRGDK